MEYTNFIFSKAILRRTFVFSKVSLKYFRRIIEVFPPYHRSVSEEILR